ncbi:hypothetical protein AB0I72_16695 [Nocardiopsis sp. NPDC049922]|uniref:hypothetical protein n=1 Tax=Nocardiopsis sp. NPDC049922 TaxID=3155157 RepID=UPI0033CC250B
MRLRTPAVCGAALVVALASVSCSGANTTLCRNGDCTVGVGGTRHSGDLWETRDIEYEFDIEVADDQSAEVTVTEEEDRRNRETDEEVTLRPGESAELFDYTVEYVSHDATDGATFEFTRG